MNGLTIIIKDFINHCRFEKGLSDKTIKAYANDLNQFLTYSHKSNLLNDIRSITKNELRGFVESVSHLKAKTVNRKIATIKALFNYLEFDERIELNPFRKMRLKVKEPFLLPKVMNIKEVTKVLKIAYARLKEVENKACYSYFEALRNVGIVELLFATGARVSEIANLKSDHIDIASGVIVIKGKGNKERLIQVCNRETLITLKEYAGIRAKRYSSEFFF